jgi:hypothetical protein
MKYMAQNPSKGFDRARSNLREALGNKDHCAVRAKSGKALALLPLVQRQPLRAVFNDPARHDAVDPHW